jgi:hypothetical protein
VSASSDNGGGDCEMPNKRKEGKGIIIPINNSKLKGV